MYGPGGRMYDFPPGMRALRHDDALHDLLGARADDVDGRRLGTVEAVLVSRADARNRFLLVRDRGGHPRAIPTQGAVAGGGRVWTPFPKKQIDQGPRLPEHGVLGPRQERDLHQLFGLPLPAEARRSGWERRATVSRAIRDPDQPKAVLWLPGPRASTDRRSGTDRRTGLPDPGADAPAPLPGGLPDRRRREGRRVTDLLAE